MTCIIDFLQEVFREFETIKITTSSLLNRGPCFLSNVVVAADNDQDLVVTVYDGFGIDGLAKLDLYGAEDKAFAFPFFPPVHFRQGMYIAMEGDIKSVTVTFLQDVPHGSRLSLRDLLGSV